MRAQVSARGVGEEDKAPPRPSRDGTNALYSIEGDDQTRLTFTESHRRRARRDDQCQPLQQREMSPPG